MGHYDGYNGFHADCDRCDEEYFVGKHSNYKEQGEYPRL